MNYKETNVTGDSWTRCCAVRVANSYQKTPIVEFVEEQITVLSDGRTISENAQIPLTLPYEPGTLIPLIDPETGGLSGEEFTIERAYAMIYSAYLYTAASRDTAQNPESQELI